MGPEYNRLHFHLRLGFFYQYNKDRMPSPRRMTKSKASSPRKNQSATGQMYQYWRKHPNPDMERGYSYAIGYAPTGRALCKACKQPIAEGSLKFERRQPNPFDGGSTDQTFNYHLDHGFDTMKRSLCTSKVLFKPSDLRGLGLDRLEKKDQALVKSRIQDFAKFWAAKCTLHSQ